MKVVRRTFWLMKVVPTWKKFEKRWPTVFSASVVKATRYGKKRCYSMDRWCWVLKMHLSRVTPPIYLTTKCNQWPWNYGECGVVGQRLTC